MDPFFAWIEEGALNDFLTESSSIFVFPSILVLHALGMGLLVGTHFAIALRMLGVAPRVPLRSMAGFIPVARLGLIINVFSGILLLISYPTKALTNPLFFVKLSLIALALLVFANIKKDIFVKDAPPREPSTRKAVLLIFLWAATIAAGRFLAYTYTRLTVFH
jgi:hypothetical protein